MRPGGDISHALLRIRIQSMRSPLHFLSVLPSNSTPLRVGIPSMGLVRAHSLHRNQLFNHNTMCRGAAMLFRDLTA